jgi:hypothetical protein
MKTSGIWDFVGSNFISLVTVLAGVVVIVLDQMGLLPGKIVSSTTLGLLALLATSEIVENRRRLSRIQDGLEGLSKQTLEATQGVSVLMFESNAEALEYVADRMREATNSIDIAALDKRRSRQSPSLEKYYKEREAAIKANRLKFRYVGVLHTPRRLESCLKYIADPKLHRYFAGFYQKPQPEIPLVTFTVIDRQEVFTRCPFKPGGAEGYVAIRSPGVASAFLDYFEELWDSSQKVQTEKDYRQLLAALSAQ